jgi:hypothetical protein
MFKNNKVCTKISNFWNVLWADFDVFRDEFAVFRPGDGFNKALKLCA